MVRFFSGPLPLNARFSGDREYKSYAIGRYADIVNDFLKAEHEHFQELLAKVDPEEVRASDPVPRRARV